MVRRSRQRGSRAARPLEQRVSVPWRVPLTQQQLARLLQGFDWRTMDDKWQVAVLPPPSPAAPDDDDDGGGGSIGGGGSPPASYATVGFVRSWTGALVAELAIEVYTTAGGDATDDDDEAIVYGNAGADSFATKDEDPALAGRITTLTFTPVHAEDGDNGVRAVKSTVRSVCSMVLGIKLAMEEVVGDLDDKAELRREE